MRFSIAHRTTYRYNRPVLLGPHLIRLRPRSDGSSRLTEYTLAIDPAPAGSTEILDHEGNVVTQAWFEGWTDSLVVESLFTSETLRENAFDWLAPLPGDLLYPESLQAALAPYLVTGEESEPLRAFADSLPRDAADFPMGFLAALNQRLFETITRELRLDGTPQSPEETLARGRGACRDLAVLFIAVCRRRGIAARFVSGYQRRSSTSSRYLHAWAEVYLPGAGWRGFDPMHGLAVTNEHVAIAAAADPAGAAPIDGSFFGDAESSIEPCLSIHVEP